MWYTGDQVVLLKPRSEATWWLNYVTSIGVAHYLWVKGLSICLPLPEQKRLVCISQPQSESTSIDYKTGRRLRLFWTFGHLSDQPHSGQKSEAFQYSSYRNKTYVCLYSNQAGYWNTLQLFRGALKGLREADIIITKPGNVQMSQCFKSLKQIKSNYVVRST